MDKNLFIIWVTTFVTMLGVGFIAPIIPIYAQTLGATNFEIGLIFGSFALARTLTQVPVGILSDIYGKKFFIVSGTFFYGLFTLLYNFVNTVFDLLIVRALTGAFSSFVTPVAGSYVAAIAPKDRLGEYMGIFNSAITLGFGVGPFIGGTLADIYGIKTPFYFCGFLGILAAIISYTKLEDIKFKKENCDKISLEFLKNKNFLYSFIINTSNVMMNAGIITYLGIYTIKYGISIAQIGSMIAGTNLLMAALQRSFGKLYDKLGKVVIIFGICIASCGVYFLSLSSSFWKIMFSLATVAIGISMCSPATTSIAVKDIPPYRKGGAMGIFTTSINIGMFLGSVFFGFLADIFGISGMFKASAMFSIIVGFICYLKIRE
ncbi:major facilitator superfamily protein [Methanocaldococcus villosus KIN24-T80]|uniref:Major facilitator superfamily protein n=1 Tax=Methanocaldococcus villosus KIN24-T80 TaxID=1069083 RepID=N6VR73_9EURY|nr:MFS transporter [Methanocaldococcus villosus]ENN96405.1 major facilitator superfamily protein [Methanocaldococcus villosus KIN24-T80]